MGIWLVWADDDLDRAFYNRDDAIAYVAEQEDMDFEAVDEIAFNGGCINDYWYISSIDVE